MMQANKLLPVLLVVLTGCEMLGSSAPPPCPHVSIIDEASSVTKFKPGSKHDIIDVIGEGKITGYSGACNYVFEDGTNNGTLTVEISIDVEARLGPANHDHVTNFDYFVSVTDAEQNVLSKEVFDIAVKFSGNRTRRKYTEDEPPVVMQIPLSDGVAGENLKIFVGFQLSAQELKFNRLRSKGFLGH